MRRDIREFLEGFGGRAVLLVAAALITVITGVGGWFAKRVGDNQEKSAERIGAISEKLAHAAGDKIGRDEFEHKLDKLSAETRDHRIETRESLMVLGNKLDHLSDVLRSRYKHIDSGE